LLLLPRDPKVPRESKGSGSAIKIKKRGLKVKTRGKILGTKTKLDSVF